ncbi:MAG TPA: PfkB family carbohydrate kinase [Ktedonobacterales bacterium]
MARARRYPRPTTAPPQPIDALFVGHLTRDVLPDGSWQPGGAVLYAGVAAARLGLRVGIVTSAPADLCARAAEALGAAPMVVVDCETATTFENVYTPAGRVQYLRASAHPLTLDDIPLEWRRCEVALLAPVAGELAPTLAGELGARVIGAAPQGWLRQWEADGRVRPQRIDGEALAALGSLSALIVSREDLTGPAADVGTLAAAEETLAAWTRLVPLLVVTRGAEGADLYRAGAVERFSGYPAREVDPTGAGDVFAAAFLCALAVGGDPAAAIDQANRVAALSVEGVGPSAIPSLAQAIARYPTRG